MDNPTPENRADLITHLQRLWQSDPGSYWRALRQSGLTAQDVWPGQAVTFVGKEIEKPETGTPPSKRKNAKKEDRA
jgi:hypothetical protein